MRSISLELIKENVYVVVPQNKKVRLEPHENTLSVKLKKGSSWKDPSVIYVGSVPYIDFGNIPAKQSLNYNLYADLERPVSSSLPEATKSIPVEETAVIPIQDDAPNYSSSLPSIPWVERFFKNRSRSLPESKQQKVRQASGLQYGDVAQKTFLVIDHADWTRSIGILNILDQLQDLSGEPIYKKFDVITGVGYGANIACALGLGRSPNEILEWWLSDWKAVHNPNFFRKFMKGLERLFLQTPKLYSHKQAYRVLQRYYAHNHNPNFPYWLNESKTQVQVTVMDAELDTHTHDSNANNSSEIAIADVVADACLSRKNFDSKVTVKNQSLFQGAWAKNNVKQIISAEKTNNVRIISVGTPVRLQQYGKHLNQATAEELLPVTIDTQHYLDSVEAEALAKKLGTSYLRLECKPIDEILPDSTTDFAIQTALESAKIQVELL